MLIFVFESDVEEKGLFVFGYVVFLLFEVGEGKYVWVVGNLFFVVGFWVGSVIWRVFLGGVDGVLVVGNYLVGDGEN